MPFRPFIPAKDFHVYSPFTRAVRDVLVESRKPFSLPAKVSLRFDDAVNECRSSKRVTKSQAYWRTMRQIAWQGRATDFDPKTRAEERNFNHAQARAVGAYRKSLPFYKLGDIITAAPTPFHAPCMSNGQRVLMGVDWDNACKIDMAQRVLRSWASHPKSTPLQTALGQSVYHYSLSI